ncbi:hypothetical protein H310_03030 [Aphanomyces invadans]|uniref:glucan endo-1,3-beta-D-glucosidase n=1 Tax=Aphanomyces invadans TaxID=157072 RepID=A0A024UKI3_9STRA|nr:hypothetical protein H310_03030 [Aphanomyces invadans]ETW06916.1 hypothetical protein H310_03030 [Aphanomyces invadans]|eukprot:XP_008864991.1 hypothetical protein H310_03030 [Aphanomyces invadans]
MAIGTAWWFVAAAVIATSTDAASGICYDSFQAIGNVDAHFAFLKQKFGAVRTYQTSVANQLNLIDAAATAGLQVAAGIWLRGPIAFEDDLKAAVDGAKRHPNNVVAVYVGNEDLDHNWSASQIADKIRVVRAAFAAQGLGRIPIGTVQTDGQFLANPDLVAVCDVVGVNIYPFFDASAFSMMFPVDNLDKRYAAMVRTFGQKVRLTETGWPSAGITQGNYVSSRANAAQYFKDYEAWVDKLTGETSQWPFYFQFADVPAKVGFEGHFGLSVDGASWKFDVIPTTTPAPTTTTPPPTTTTPKPTTTTPKPTTTMASTSTVSPAANAANGSPKSAAANLPNGAGADSSGNPSPTVLPNDAPPAPAANGNLGGGSKENTVEAITADAKSSTSTSSGAAAGWSVFGIVAGLVVGFVAIRKYRQYLNKKDRDVCTDASGQTFMTYQRGEVAIL